MQRQNHGSIRLAANQPSARLLVVDDRTDNRNLLATILRGAGFEVRTVGDGDAALDVAATWRPDLVLLDRRMPGMGGDEVVARLQGEPERPVVVALTASTLTPNSGDLEALGYDDFLAKPFTQEQLFTLLERHLRVRFEEGAAADPVAAEALTPGELRALPEAWRIAFRRAVVRGHTSEMLDLAGRLEPTLADLSARIGEHVRNFQLDALLAAISEPAAEVGGPGETPVHQEQTEPSA